MKKIIGFFGVLAISLSIFLSTNDSNLNDFNLATLMSMNTANAEDGPYDVVCKCNFWGNCKASGARSVCASFNGNGFCRDYDSNC